MDNPGGRDKMGATLPYQMVSKRLGRAREREAVVQSEERGGRVDRVWTTGPVSLTRVYTSLGGWDQPVERPGTKGITVNILGGD